MNDIEILEDMIKDYENKIEHEYGFSDYYIQKIKKEKQAIENLLENSKKIIELNYIQKSKVKEKMQKDIKINEHVILGGRRNGKTLEYGKRLGRIEMCEELLEEGDDK